MFYPRANAGLLLLHFLDRTLLATLRQCLDAAAAANDLPVPASIIRRYTRLDDADRRRPEPNRWRKSSGIV